MQTFPNNIEDIQWPGRITSLTQVKLMAEDLKSLGVQQTTVSDLPTVVIDTQLSADEEVSE